jgi:hypothetical protein
MTKKTFVTVAVIVVLVGGGSFYGGMRYAQSTRQNFASRNLGGQRNGTANIGGLRGGGSGGFTAGEIIAKDNTSITIKLNDGGSKIVFYSDATEVDKFAKGTAGDLQIGESVTVSGQANQDGSLTAQTIQIRPARPAAPAGQ